MPYSYSTNIVLASTDIGLTLSAQLVDTAGANVGGAVTAGFLEFGVGQYGFTHSFPDGFQGFVKFFDGATLKAVSQMNPMDGENLDSKVSTRASQSSVDMVAGYIDTEVAAIKTKTDQLTFTVAGRVDAQVLGMGTDTLTADALATSAVLEIQGGMIGGSQVIEVVKVEQTIEVCTEEV